MSEHDELVEKVARAIYESRPRRNLYYSPPIPWDYAGTEEQEARRIEARAALSAMPTAGDGWQDIASAPRDGTLCLFFAPGRNKAKYIERAKRQMTVVDAFSPQWVNGKYQLPENPYTHWRPLPTPPGEKP